LGSDNDKEGDMHDETYRMLGREHEADLERDAAKWRLAAEARGATSPPKAVPEAGARSRLGRLMIGIVARVLAPTRQPSVK
jgi:hypothetical protein